MNYVDVSQVANKPLFKELLNNDELYHLRLIPLNADKSNVLFGVTTTTSQQTMNGLQQRFQDQRVRFALISDTGFRDYMHLYDCLKQVIYQDIAVNTAGTHELVQNVSAVLEQVRADDMLAYHTEAPG